MQRTLTATRISAATTYIVVLTPCRFVLGPQSPPTPARRSARLAELTLAAAESDAGRSESSRGGEHGHEPERIRK